MINRNLTSVLAALGVVLILGGAYYYYYKGGTGIFGNRITYELPPLPYAFDALEPYIDSETMKIHYTKHHQGYVNKLNAVLKDYPEVASKELNQLLSDPLQMPEAVRTAVIDNGGGHYNHTYYWYCMTPTSTKEPVDGMVKELINKQYGSFDAFKKQFAEEALNVFGSGWVWFVSDKQGALKIITTANQDGPLELGLFPLIAFDVWEHAYYLKHQNKRADYIDAWWNVVHWEQVEKNYQVAQSGEQIPFPDVLTKGMSTQ